MPSARRDLLLETSAAPWRLERRPYEPPRGGARARLSAELPAHAGRSLNDPLVPRARCRAPCARRCVCARRGCLCVRRAARAPACVMRAALAAHCRAVLLTQPSLCANAASNPSSNYLPSSLFFIYHSPPPPIHAPLTPLTQHSTAFIHIGTLLACQHATTPCLKATLSSAQLNGPVTPRP